MSNISEHFDQQIYSIYPLSGHTMKHFLAGVATLYIYRWIHASRFEARDSGSGTDLIS